MKRAGWTGAALFFAVLAVVPAMVTQRIASGVTKAEFDPVPTRFIEHVRPGYVFLGNSMLDSRAIGDVFGALAGAPALNFSIPGVMSAAWYLQLKHQIATAKTPPGTVFVLFRDTHLTRPELRARGNYARRLEPLHPGDAELAHMLAGSAEHLPWYARLWGLPQLWLHHLYPAERAVRAGQHWIPGIGFALLGHREEGARRRFRTRVDTAFRRDRFRSTAGVDTGDTAGESVYDFNASVGHSFLPLMFREADRAGIRLCFVRVRTRRTAEGQPEPPPLTQYVRDLRTWVRRRGGCFVDMSEQQAITPEWYADGDHIRVPLREAWTRLFYAAVKDELQ